MSAAPDLVIFDCDGVLIDSEPLASRTLSETLRTADVNLSPRQVHALFTGKAESDIRRLCVQDYGLADAEDVFAAWHAALYARFAVELQPMAGMPALVGAIGTAKCVASNSGSERLRASLGRTPLWGAFAPHVYGADAVARPKPAPDLLLHCARMLAAEPSRTIMIDDSPHGIAAARAAGMTAIGFVDLNDPRPDRPAVLDAAGAHCIAAGADALRDALAALGCALVPSTSAQEAHHNG